MNTFVYKNPLHSCVSVCHKMNWCAPILSMSSGAKKNNISEMNRFMYVCTYNDHFILVVDLSFYSH